MELHQILSRLWSDYINQNPSAGRIFQLFQEKGERVQNDHIAFRTFDDPLLNIDVLAKVFIKNGYRQKGEYQFPDKHLYARHFEIEGNNSAPRIFISQLILSEFSEYLQTTIRKVISSVAPEIYSSPGLIYSGSIFGKPSFETYTRLREESEYAAWVYVFGFRANHFTISVNSLKKFNSLEEVNQLVKANGFLLNSSGGEIKGTREELLRQSSTMADPVNVPFEEGEFEIPACYYEFAERFSDSEGRLYSGFIAKSADKIFESTNFYSKK